jgi:hypothetical protein
MLDNHSLLFVDIFLDEGIEHLETVICQNPPKRRPRQPAVEFSSVS